MEGSVSLSIWEFAALVAAAARGDGLAWLRQAIQRRLGQRSGQGRQTDTSEE